MTVYTLLFSIQQQTTETTVVILSTTTTRTLDNCNLYNNSIQCGLDTDTVLLIHTDNTILHCAYTLLQVYNYSSVSGQATMKLGHHYNWDTFWSTKRTCTVNVPLMYKTISEMRTPL